MSLLKQRTLNVAGMTGAGCERRIESALMALPGVSGADATAEDGRILVEYDLLKVNLREVEQSLAQAGYPLSGGLLTRLKRNFLHDMEENEKSNYLTVPMCCSKKAQQIVDSTRRPATARN